VPVHERSDIIVAGVLERLRAEDERLGSDAEAALTSLTWDEGLETITQYACSGSCGTSCRASG